MKKDTWKRDVKFATWPLLDAYIYRPGSIFDSRETFAMRRERFIGFVQKISAANESKLRKLGARLARETRKIYDSGRKKRNNSNILFPRTVRR